MSFLCSHQLNCLLLSAQPPSAAPALHSRALAEATQQKPEVSWLCVALGMFTPQIHLGSSSSAELCSSVMLGSNPGLLLQLLGMEQGTQPVMWDWSQELLPLAAPAELVFLPAVYPTGIPGILLGNMQNIQFSYLESKKKLKNFIVIEMSRAQLQCKY